MTSCATTARAAPSRSRATEPITTVRAAKLAVHRELHHGWPATFMPFDTFFDGQKNEWLAGYSLVTQGCISKLPPPGSTLATLAADPATAKLIGVTKQCVLCFFDDSVSSWSRVRELEHSPLLDHIYRKHFVKQTSENRGHAQDSKSMDAALMTSHRELEHDYPALVSASVYHDENKRIWIAEFARIQHHFAVALPHAGSTLSSLAANDASIPSTTKKQCIICLFDGGRSPHCRAKTMEASPNNDHVIECHCYKDSVNYNEADETHLCPCCGKVLPTTDFLQSLQIDRHQNSMRCQWTRAAARCCSLRQLAPSSTRLASPSTARRTRASSIRALLSSTPHRLSLTCRRSEEQAVLADDEEVEGSRRSAALALVLENSSSFAAARRASTAEFQAYVLIESRVIHLVKKKRHAARVVKARATSTNAPSSSSTTTFVARRADIAAGRAPGPSQAAEASSAAGVSPARCPRTSRSSRQQRQHCPPSDGEAHQAVAGRRGGARPRLFEEA